ncbi:hypothetical protein CC78DRAFT_114635 [Lojkania enalia]|uniref:Uncharacterized protein n=1 Tax=Lojkania enalia TaxID=147567 RepID=A0A9P4JWW1_9PLEO|nr:hypothetical protein CC78DRAFT_114635 [Didymosphaeria enalia]
MHSRRLFSQAMLQYPRASLLRSSFVYAFFSIKPASNNSISRKISSAVPKQKDNPSSQLKSTANPSTPSLNLFSLLRECSLPVRCTVYAGLSVLAAMETTFWINVIRYRYFSPEKDKADEFFVEVRKRVQRYRELWIQSYGEYYSGTLWGL